MILLRYIRVIQHLASKLLPGFVVPPIYVADHGEDGAATGAAASIRQSLFSLLNLESNTSHKYTPGTR